MYKVAKQWRQKWQDLGYHLLSRRLDNIQKVYWNAHSAKNGESLTLAKKVVRQFILGHVAFDDATLLYALSQLIDTNAAYTQVQRDKLAVFQERVADYVTLLGENPSPASQYNACFKINRAISHKSLYAATRLNNCWTTEGGNEEWVTFEGVLEFDDNVIFNNHTQWTKLSTELIRHDGDVTDHALRLCDEAERK